jgi:hypothetical protein
VNGKMDVLCEGETHAKARISNVRFWVLSATVRVKAEIYLERQSIFRERDDSPKKVDEGIRSGTGTNWKG